jgi:hypothetical protein
LNPQGAADVQTPAYAAAITIAIINALTHVTLSNAMSGALTVNFTFAQGIRRGARVLLQALSDGTARTITPGTGALGTAEAGVISKTKILEFEYNGTAMVLKNARQID